MKFVTAMSAALAIVAMSWVVASSSAHASADSDKAEIVALNQRLNDATNKRDCDEVMACFVEEKDAVFSNDTTPFKLKGTSALRKYIQKFIQSTSHIQTGMEAVSIVVSADLAVARYTAPLTWTDKDGTHS